MLLLTDVYSRTLAAVPIVSKKRTPRATKRGRQDEETKTS